MGQITADASIVIQALFRNNNNGDYYEAAVPSQSPGKEFLIPFDATTFQDTGEPFYTGFAIANTDQSPANVACTARDSNGVVIANAVSVPALNPLGHWAGYQFPVLAGQRGTIDCVSNTNIAATALRVIGSRTISSLPVINQLISTGGAKTTILPHFAAGGQWTTGLFVVNTSAQPANFSIAFYDDTGRAVTVPFSTGGTSKLSGVIQGRGSAYYEAADPTLAQILSGWGQITADASIVIQALFRNNNNGDYYEAAVPSQSPGKEFLIPFDATTFQDTGEPFYTGFAIANTSQSPANVACTARDSNGVVIANAVSVPALNPLGHWAGYQFPVLAGQRGTIDCVSNTNIAATALRVIGSRTISSLPVIGISSNGQATTSVLQIISGNSQSTNVNDMFSEPLVIRVVDKNGYPIKGTAVLWSVSGSASLTNASAVSDEDGQVWTRLLASEKPGAIVVTAQTTPYDSVEFRVTATSLR